MPKIKYPKIFLRSKNDLSKRLSHRKFSQKEALFLINDCIKNKDKYWEDYLAMSEPKNNKYVRNSSGTNLGKLLKLIDKNILQPYDNLLPNYIYGGIKGRNHAMAAKNLLGNRNKKTLLKIDLVRFFEQVSKNRVESFFILKTGCSKGVAKILSELCCVPLGKKGGGGNNYVLARGFPTSSRLSIWTNINLFNKLFEISFSKMRKNDFRISIYVDDIGIMVNKITDIELIKLRNEIEEIFLNFDKNHKLIMHSNNSKKGTSIIHHSDGPEFLGVGLLRNKLSVGLKSSSKRYQIRNMMQNKSSGKHKQIKKRYAGMQRYKKYIESV
jgi:hypothetical protein